MNDEPDDSSLSSTIYKNMQARSDDELLKIWELNDREQWSDTAYSVVEEILRNRLGQLPPQKAPGIVEVKAPAGAKAGKKAATLILISFCVLVISGCLTVITVSSVAYTWSFLFGFIFIASFLLILGILFEASPQGQTAGFSLLGIHDKPMTGMPASSHAQTPFKIMDSAYLVRSDEELDFQVRQELDTIAQGESGIQILIERLYRDMTLEGVNLQIKVDGELAWNEYLKMREVVRALGRAHAEVAVPVLIPLLTARTPFRQFYEILQPAVARAIGEIGDKLAVKQLNAVLMEPGVFETTKDAVSEALEKLK